MPWYEKAQPTPFDTAPVEGHLQLDGALIAKRFQQAHFHTKKFPTITFPSGLIRELWDSADEHGIVNIFGGCELLRHSTRDEGLTQATIFASDYSYGVAKRGENELLIFNPASGRGYLIMYDNQTRQLIDVRRFPAYAMDLLDVESRAALPDFYSTEALGLSALALVKFFTPDANWTWYASEYDGDDLFYGLVSGLEVELGYFSLTELESVTGALNLPIERDLYFTPTPLHQLLQRHRE